MAPRLQINRAMTGLQNTIDRDREDLAAAIRLAERFNFHEGICNHFSVQCDTEDELYLINSYGWHWSEVTPDRLLLIDSNGNVIEGEGTVDPSAQNIHIAGHQANPRHKAIFHAHMPNATALTMLENPELLMAHQTAIRFYGRIAYEKDFGGFAVSKEEARRMAQEAAANAHIDCVMLAHHGVVCSGPSVAHAFDDLYYLERAAQQQVLAYSTGHPIKLIPSEIVELTSRQFLNEFDHYAKAHFEALKRLVEL